MPDTSQLMQKILTYPLEKNTATARVRLLKTRLIGNKFPCSCSSYVSL